MTETAPVPKIPGNTSARVDDSIRVDIWIWSVRLFKNRTLATAACRGGHVRVNDKLAKASTSVKVGDQIRISGGDRLRLVEVRRIIRKRVGASVAAECLIDNSPPIIPRERLPIVAQREPGSGRPTKRERRKLDELRGWDSANRG